jgi:hypothetical protein
MLIRIEKNKSREMKLIMKNNLKETDLMIVCCRVESNICRHR